MRRCALLLLLVSCKEEKPAVTLEPTDAATPIVTTPALTTTTATQAEIGAEVERPRAPVAGAARARAARAQILAQRKQVVQRVRALEARVGRLEATLKVTGPRNDQVDVLSELGRSRGELAKVRSIRTRCERAFDGDEWSEIEAAWLLAEDLAAEGETDAAAENYQRFIAMVADFRAHCAELEPIKGAR